MFNYRAVQRLKQNISVICATSIPSRIIPVAYSLSRNPPTPLVPLSGAEVLKEAKHQIAPLTVSSDF